jgi:hypothetical protein
MPLLTAMRTWPAIAAALILAAIVLTVVVAAAILRIALLAIFCGRCIGVIATRRGVALRLLARRTRLAFGTGFGRTAFAVLFDFGGVAIGIGHRRTSWVPLENGGLKDRKKMKQRGRSPRQAPLS